MFKVFPLGSKKKAWRDSQEWFVSCVLRSAIWLWVWFFSPNLYSLSFYSTFFAGGIWLVNFWRMGKTKPLIFAIIFGKLELTIKIILKIKFSCFCQFHLSPEYKIKHTIGAVFSEGHCFSLSSGAHKMAALRREGRCPRQLARWSKKSKQSLCSKREVWYSKRC